MPAQLSTCMCGLNRRHFLRLAGSATLAAGFPATAAAQSVETEEVRTLLLICNEPRVWAQADAYLRSRQITGKIEPVEVIGASIGLVAEPYEASRQAFWDKLMTAAAFQQTRRVIALNHRGCAAMTVAYGLTRKRDGLIETETHRYALREFRRRMAERNADIDVWIGLIGLDGKTEMFG